jgi:hypothetical protein
LGGVLPIRHSVKSDACLSRAQLLLVLSWVLECQRRGPSLLGPIRGSCGYASDPGHSLWGHCCLFRVFRNHFAHHCRPNLTARVWLRKQTALSAHCHSSHAPARGVFARCCQPFLGVQPRCSPCSCGNGTLLEALTAPAPLPPFLLVLLLSTTSTTVEGDQRRGGVVHTGSPLRHLQCTSCD